MGARLRAALDVIGRSTCASATRTGPWSSTRWAPPWQTTTPPTRPPRPSGSAAWPRLRSPRSLEIIGAHPTKFASHNWRAAGAGNLGGWQTARCLFFLNVLTGSVGTVGGTTGNGWNKYKAPHPPGAPPFEQWNELTWPREYPLAYHEMSILLPHFLAEGRGRLEVYFSRVYNPVWTNPDGFSWLEALSDPDKVSCHVALTPTWSETALFADYVLPMGVGAERHDVASFETHAGRWIGFRQPVLRRYAEIRGERRDPRVAHARVQSGRGVGGERVLDRVVVAHRPRRLPGHPPLVREPHPTLARR